MSYAEGCGDWGQDSNNSLHLVRPLFGLKSVTRVYYGRICHVFVIIYITATKH